MFNRKNIRSSLDCSVVEIMEINNLINKESETFALTCIRCVTRCSSESIKILLNLINSGTLLKNNLLKSDLFFCIMDRIIYGTSVVMLIEEHLDCTVVHNLQKYRFCL